TSYIHPSSSNGLSTRVASMGETFFGIAFFTPLEGACFLDWVADLFFFVSCPFVLFDCHTLSAAFSTCLIVRPVSTDLSFFVISEVRAYLSFIFISSQELSPLDEAFTSANSPFSFCPWSLKTSLPAWSCFINAFS